MKKRRIKADISKANGFKIWKHCDEVGADTDGHIYQKIKGAWHYAYEYLNQWGKCKLIPEHYASCYKRVQLAKSDNLETLGLCKYPGLLGTFIGLKTVSTIFCETILDSSQIRIEQRVPLVFSFATFTII